MGLKFWVCMLIAWLLLFMATCVMHIRLKENVQPRHYKIGGYMTTPYVDDGGHAFIIEESMQEEEDEDRYMY